MKTVRAVLILMAVVALCGCRRQAPPEPPVARPSVALSRDKAPLSSPIDITYRFDVDASAPAMTENYKVFVGVVDSDGELMWNDDHDPSIPTSQWKPGQKIEYTRTVFVPVYPYIGEASMRMGLYSTSSQKRVSLSGDDAGQRAYKVAQLQILPQSENIFLVFKDGWHTVETPPNNANVQWQWTKREATLAFKNPKKDCLLYLDVDNPSPAFPEGQRVQIKLREQVPYDFVLEPDRRVLHRILLRAAQLGDGDVVELKIVADKTFVPVQLPGATNKDPRELGVRAFHAFVEVKQ